MAANKKHDVVLANKLFPVYCENSGVIARVHDYCKKEKIEISHVTLGNMAAAFFWKTKYEEQQRSKFISNAGSDLETMLSEATHVKNGLLGETDRESLRLAGTFMARITEIKKLQIAEQAVDKDRLLVDALKAVVEFFKDQGEQGMAALLGENLESIGEKVKERWQRKN